MAQQPNLNDDAPAVDEIEIGSELQQCIFNVVNKHFTHAVNAGMKQQISNAVSAFDTQLSATNHRIDGLQTCIDLNRDRLNTIEARGNAALARGLRETQEELAALRNRFKVFAVIALSFLVGLSFVLYLEEVLRPFDFVRVLVLMVAAYFSVNTSRLLN